MIKELIHDPIFLVGKSEIATKEDLQLAQDLLYMLIAHMETRCSHSGEVSEEDKQIGGWVMLALKATS